MRGSTRCYPCSPWAGLCDVTSRSRAEVWSVGRKLWLVRGELPLARWQWTASRGSAGALRGTAQHPRDGANGPFGQLEEVWLWKFVGRAGVPCLSTVRVSTRARVIYKFCSVYKRAAVMESPLATTPTVHAPAAALDRIGNL